MFLACFRLSSIQLLGELLYQVSGVTGKMSTHGEEDDNFGTMEGQKVEFGGLSRKRSSSFSKHWRCRNVKFTNHIQTK